jgi:pimeloyl-ACP methyl ester carboxylesterase
MNATYLTLQERFLCTQGTVARRYDVWLKSLGLRASVLEAGAGEPVLLVHGGGATAVSMEPLLSRLQHQFHLVVPDRPGCGGSDFVDYRTVNIRDHAVAFLEGVLDHFGIDRVNLIGNSIGGYFGLVFALERPDRIRKLVLVGAPTGLDLHAPILFRLLGVPGLNRLLTATVARPSLRLMKKLFAFLVADLSHVTCDHLRIAYAQAIIPGAQESWLSILEELTTIRGLRPRHYLFPELNRLRQPILFVWGNRDRFSPPSVGTQACAVLPDAQIVILDDAGHLCWMDRTDDCVRATVEFLA